MANSNENLDELIPVTKNYTKKESSDADLVYDGENFQVSDQLFARLNLNDNGFKLYFNPNSNEAFLAVLPREQSIHYKGKKGYDKTQTFTSSEMIDKLDELGILNEGEKKELWLKDAGEKDGVNFFKLIDVNPRTLSDTDGQTESTSEQESGDFVDLPQQEQPDH